MFLRYQVWQDVITIAGEVQTAWVNEFRVPYSCVDVRLRLAGYGWKPNVEDENIPVLYEGVYKCYYRKVGDTDWTMFARAIVERASTDDAFVYKDVIVDTGDLEKDIYDIRVEAMRGSEFEAWGGAIEGISKGGRFWYGLEMRADKPLELYAEDWASVSEYCYCGENPIEVFVWIDFAVIDYAYDGFIGYQIEVTDVTINVLEAVYFLTNTYRQVIEVIHVSEYTEFWSSIINLWSPVEHLNIEEVSILGYDIWWFYIYDLISVVDYVNIDWFYRSLFAYDDAVINEVPTFDFVYWLYLLTTFQTITITENLNIVRDLLFIVYDSVSVAEYGNVRPLINVYENVISVSEFRQVDTTTVIWEDECSGTTGLWTYLPNGANCIFTEDPIGQFRVGFTAASGTNQIIDIRRTATLGSGSDISWRMKLGDINGAGNTGNFLQVRFSGSHGLNEIGMLLQFNGKKNTQTWWLLDVHNYAIEVREFQKNTWYEFKVRMFGHPSSKALVGEIYVDSIYWDSFTHTEDSYTNIGNPITIGFQPYSTANNYADYHIDWVRVKSIDTNGLRVVVNVDKIITSESKAVEKV